MCNSSSRASGTFWGPWTPGMHVVHLQTHGKRTYTHKKIQNLKNKIKTKTDSTAQNWPGVSLSTVPHCRLPDPTSSLFAQVHFSECPFFLLGFISLLLFFKLEESRCSVICSNLAGHQGKTQGGFWTQESWDTIHRQLPGSSLLLRTVFVWGSPLPTILLLSPVFSPPLLSSPQPSLLSLSSILCHL